MLDLGLSLVSTMNIIHNNENSEFICIKILIAKISTYLKDSFDNGRNSPNTSERLSLRYYVCLPDTQGGEREVLWGEVKKQAEGERKGRDQRVRREDEWLRKECCCQ